MINLFYLGINIIFFFFQVPKLPFASLECRPGSRSGTTPPCQHKIFFIAVTEWPGPLSCLRQSTEVARGWSWDDAFISIISCLWGSNSMFFADWLLITRLSQLTQQWVSVISSTEWECYIILWKSERWSSHEVKPETTHTHTRAGASQN